MKFQSIFPIFYDHEVRLMSRSLFFLQPTRRQFLQTAMASTVVLGGLSSIAASKNEKIKMFKNLSGGHIGLNAGQKQSIELAAQYGFEGAAPNLDELVQFSPAQRKEMVDLLQEKGLRWGASGLPVEFRRDEDTFQKGIEAFPQQAAVLKEVGVTRMATWIMPGSNDLTYLEDFEQHRRRLKECALILKDQGIRLGLEFVGPRTTRRQFRFAFACTQREMLELCNAIGTGNVGLLLDVWHWYTSHGTTEEIQSLTNDLIVLVHVSDAPKDIPVDEQQDMKRELPCTTGVIDMKTFITTLYKIGYDGPVECEPFDEELRKMETDVKLKKTFSALDRVFDLIEV